MVPLKINIINKLHYSTFIYNQSLINSYFMINKQ